MPYEYFIALFDRSSYFIKQFCSIELANCNCLVIKILTFTQKKDFHLLT